MSKGGSRECVQRGRPETKGAELGGLPGYACDPQLPLDQRILYSGRWRWQWALVRLWRGGGLASD
jgi:hypothetical protein